MKDPHMIQHQAYLKSVEDFAARGRLRSYKPADRCDMSAPARAMAVVAVVAAIVALSPWGLLLV